FAREFPATLPKSRFTTLLLAMVSAIVVAAMLTEGIAHIPGFLDHAALRTQAAVISLSRLSQQLVFAGAAIGVIVLAMRQRKLAASRTARVRSSGRMVSAAIAFGFIPPMGLALLQLAFDVAFGTRPIPRSLLSASFLTLLVIPAAVMTAVMAKRVDSGRLVARRALLFAVTDRGF